MRRRIFYAPVHDNLAQVVAVEILPCQGEALRQVAVALASNVTLESVTVSPDNCSSAPDHYASLSTSLLSSLAAHPCLKELMLQASWSTADPIRRPAYELNDFLNSSRTLTHLGLNSYSFGQEHSFENFSIGSLFSRNVTKLSFDCCEFDEQATRLFVDLLKYPNARSTSVRSLCCGPNNRFADPVGKVICNIFKPLVVNDAPTKAMTTALQELEINSWRFWTLSTDLAFIFQSFNDNAAVTPLRRFVYGYMYNVGSEALIACLPNLLYLKELVILEIDQDVRYKDRILLGLKRNGSLERVELTRTPDVPYYREGVPFFSESELCKVKCYCLRNQRIPSMARLDYKARTNWTRPTGGSFRSCLERPSRLAARLLLFCL